MNISMTHTLRSSGKKQLKAGSRKQKTDLINGMNPEWRDLYEELKEW